MPANGTRRVSGQLLTPSTSASSASSGYSPPPRAMPVKVPIGLHTAQAIEFLGFSPKRAQALFDVFMEDTDDDWLDFIIQNILMRDADALDNSDDWVGAMQEMGIGTLLQEAIMDEEFESLRLTQSLKYWVADSIQTRWDSLNELNERVVQHLNLKPGTPHLRGGVDTDRQTFQRNLPGHVTLYRATTKSRLKDVVKKDGKVNLAIARSSPPGDFNSDFSALYFTREEEVVKQYAKFCRRRCPHANVVYLQMWVPEHHFQDVRTAKLEYGDLWRKLVFYSRRNDTYPEDVNKIAREKDIIIGPVSTPWTGHFQKMKTWKEVTERNVWRNGGKYVWMNEEVVTKLSELVRGKVNIYGTHERLTLIAEPWAL
ncbi:hypothetical protein P154DRAFT_593613 [Amniculicola lignicola CBS 123094]|uniref:Uncharacterized protein n=1 Tax=Amniculicola lignicola CBS 123094 TaxID=1392246 RepID=A0A6A5WYH0_9PLEO|nr:hypothetical protein P154DRAFT_593613 [Amniculicola lignicola CBS 123094]